MNPPVITCQTCGELRSVADGALHILMGHIVETRPRVYPWEKAARLGCLMLFLYWGVQVDAWKDAAGWWHVGISTIV